MKMDAVWILKGVNGALGVTENRGLVINDEVVALTDEARSVRIQRRRKDC